MVIRFCQLLFLFLFLLKSFSLYATAPVASNVRLQGGMKNGLTLTATWDYFDADGHPQSGTTIQYWRYDDNCGTNPVLIQTGTSPTLNIGGGLINLHVAVRIIPRDANGEIGATVEYRPWSCAPPSPAQDIGPNPVLTTTANCARAGGVGVPIPGNIILNPSGLCSPRSLDWQVEYTGINYNAASLPKIIIDWADGLVETLDPVKINIYETNLSKQLWRVTRNHVYSYPTTGGTSVASTTANERCT
jgi:hypothetical protein